jgi:hypothetical protein
VPVAVDACNGSNINVSILSTVTNGPCPVLITRTWLATDACGNTNTCSQTVKILDTPVVLSCPSNIVICATNGCGPMPDATSLVQATNYNGIVHVIQDIGPGTILCSNSLVNFTITDDCGNQAHCASAVTVGSTNALITGYTLLPDGFHVMFVTQPGFTYAVQYSDTLLPNSWLSLPTVTGDGAIHEVVDTRPLASARFYRLQRLCP